MELLLSSAWLVIIAWLIARAIKQRGLLPRLSSGSSPSAERAAFVTIIIPARDEETNIGPCVRSLLAQDYPRNRFRIVVVDDHSTDATAAVVRELAARHPLISLIKTPSLPPRWTGKSHACWVGVRAALPQTEWLCFIDADVQARAGALSSAVHAASMRHLDLLSLAPRQELRSFAERLILPCGLILLSFLQDLRQSQARSSDDVAATGQFMLVRRSAYEAVGGHAAVCRAICEDLEFARRLKQSGRSVLLMGGEQFLSARMYTGWRTLWPGLAEKSCRYTRRADCDIDAGARGRDLGVGGMGGPTHRPGGFMAAWKRCDFRVAACARRVGGGDRFAYRCRILFRIPFWYGLIFPLGYTAGALMALDSVRRRRSGRVLWKGRIYS